LNERERQDYNKFIEEERKEQAAITAKREASEKTRELEKEMSRNTKLYRDERVKTLQGYTEAPYISPALENSYMSHDDASRFDAEQAKIFVENTPEWWPSQENIATLIHYFENHNLQIVDASMFKSAFLSLRKSGLIDERPVPAPAPAPVNASRPVHVSRQDEDFSNLPRVPLSYSRPSGYRRPSEGSQRGFDVNGREKDFTDLEVSAMSSEEYKRAFRLSIPVLNRNNFI
jgi:hypothetical protein